MVQMKIDFHIHTYHSYDSLMRPAKILRVARRRGLDGIVVCDHNTIKGGIETQRLNRDKNFHVIVGAEIATDAGDITGIFLTKEIESRNFEDVIKEIRSQNGKVILNHPYKGHDLTKIDLSKIDFIEGYNSRLNFDVNQEAIKLAMENNIAIIAGSDAHCYPEIGNSVTLINDITTLLPVDREYKKSSQIYITVSQYIKAVKKKDLTIAVSATLNLVKYMARQFIKLIRKALTR